ncbi:MAG TPA: polyphenol oxidase family protein [Acidimicrobiales bacterium]|nr:polyphenol oxidase family protein [Acidimicrobiales bacterium]
MGHGGDRVLRVRPDVAARRRAVVDLPWTWLHQIHGAGVVRVNLPGDGAGTKADAAVTAEEGCALAVLTADCAPVALASHEGVIGVVHAGWRGVAGGVIEAAVAEMEALGATGIEAALGPCIHAECYEFGPPELDRVAARLGAGVRATTAAGTPALDLPAAVRVALHRAGVETVTDVDVCTACSPDHFSWRARRETQRQAAVVWR